MKYRILFVLICGLLGQSAIAQKQEFTSLEEALKSPEAVIQLDLSYQGLKTFPKEIFQFLNLKSLNLSHNELVEVPNEIVDLKQLRELDLSRNGISEIPGMISDLTLLEALNLSHNNFSQVPTFNTNMEALHRLDLSNNNIRKSLYRLSSFPNLMDLNLAYNSIKRIEDSFDPMISNLESFNVNYNKISYISQQVDAIFGEEIWETNTEVLEIIDMRELMGLTKEEIITYMDKRSSDYEMYDASTTGNPIQEYTEGLTIITYTCSLMGDHAFRFSILIDNEHDRSVRGYYSYMNGLQDYPESVLRFLPWIEEGLFSLYGDDPKENKNDIDDYEEMRFTHYYYSWLSESAPDIYFVIYRNKGGDYGWKVECRTN